MYDDCPIKGKDLGKLATASARRADALDQQYADWHKYNGQQLKKKYQRGKHYKSVRGTG